MILLHWTAVAALVTGCATAAVTAGALLAALDRAAALRHRRT